MCLILHNFAQFKISWMHVSLLLVSDRRVVRAQQTTNHNRSSSVYQTKQVLIRLSDDSPQKSAQLFLNEFFFLLPNRPIQLIWRKFLYSFISTAKISQWQLFPISCSLYQLLLWCAVVVPRDLLAVHKKQNSTRLRLLKYPSLCFSLFTFCH